MPLSSTRFLASSDLSSLRGLFRSFPGKAAQQRFQQLDPERLADFFCAAEERRLALAGESPRQWVVEKGGALRAYTALHPDSWHSRFYGLPFGRIAPFLSHEGDASDRAALIDAIHSAARHEGYQHLLTRVDGSEFAAMQQFCAAGYYLVDCSVKMSGRLDDVPRFAQPSRAAGMAVRLFQEKDLPDIRQIAASSHPHNHYYNDPHLAKEGTDRLFEAWVERCCCELKSDVYVLEHRDSVRGFAIYLRPQAFNAALGTRLGVLDFICLDQSVRGGGLGRWLLSESLQALASRFSQVELRTSHNNYPALDCYATLGMRIVSTDFTLHRHCPK